ncbi:MAG: nucleotidyltransferase family protein [Cyanobacteria bacterium HKST-UBA01]|nr:nucleotidyltransferase family protein [Cyanobacteria bacterium HKST-UBA01]
MKSTSENTISEIKEIKEINIWNDEFQRFSRPEEAAFLNLITNKQQVDTANFDWKRALGFTFLVPLLWRYKDKFSSEMPEQVFKQSKFAYQLNISDNEQRLLYIKELAELFQNAGLKAVFIKGAAELCRFQDDESYLGCRTMTDIDVLIDIKDLQAIDDLLTEKGFEFHLFGQAISQFEARQYALKHVGQYIYEAHTDRHLEVHPEVADPQSYPPGFSQLLIEQSEIIDLDGTSVWVPSQDHMFLQFLLNVSSRRDNKALTENNGFYLDRIIDPEGMLSAPELINQRQDIYQLHYLLRLSLLSDKLKDQIDRSCIEQFIGQTNNSDLLGMYLNVAAFYLKDRFPLRREASLDLLAEERRRYIQNYCQTSMAEKLNAAIEKTVINRAEIRLKEMLDDGLDARMKQLIEQKYVNEIENRVIDRVKRAIRSRIKDFFKAPVSVLKHPVAGNPESSQSDAELKSDG